jgi:hypothetical protein
MKWPLRVQRDLASLAVLVGHAEDKGRWRKSSNFGAGAEI